MIKVTEPIAFVLLYEFVFFFDVLITRLRLFPEWGNRVQINNKYPHFQVVH